MAETHRCILKGLKLSSSSGQTPKRYVTVGGLLSCQRQKKPCSDIPDWGVCLEEHIVLDLVLIHPLKENSGYTGIEANIYEQALKIE